MDRTVGRINRIPLEDSPVSIYRPDWPQEPVTWHASVNQARNLPYPVQNSRDEIQFNSGLDQRDAAKSPPIRDVRPIAGASRSHGSLFTDTGDNCLRCVIGHISGPLPAAGTDVESMADLSV